jgi:hypothetical protein
METESNGACFSLSCDGRGVAYLNIRAGKINVLGISKMEPLFVRSQESKAAIRFDALSLWGEAIAHGSGAQISRRW